MSWKAAGERPLLGLQGPPDALGDHGWKRREGNHVQVRGCERPVATRHTTKRNLFHALRSEKCLCSHGAEQGAVPCALPPEPAGSGAAGAAPWSCCREPGRFPSEHQSEQKSGPFPVGKACEGKGKSLRILPKPAPQSCHVLLVQEKAKSTTSPFPCLPHSLPSSAKTCQDN